MNRFRRFLAAAMFACLVLCSCGAEAEHIVSSSGWTASTQVSLELGEEPSSFTIVIPATLELDPQTGAGSLTVKVRKGFILTDVSKLHLEIQHSSSDSNKEQFAIRKKTNGTQLLYNITDSEGKAVKYGDEILPVYNTDDNSEDISCTLNLAVDGELPSSGSYSGYISFIVRTTPL